MASTTDIMPAAPAAERAESGSRGRGNRGRGRGQGRGRGGPGEAGSNNRRGGGAGRGQPRGGGFPAQSVPNLSAEQAVQASPQRKLPSKSGVDSIEKKTGDVEAEVCFICASDVEHMSVSPCNHRICHICALRMRVLYKDYNCAHCRTKSEIVIFTDDPTKHYEDFTDADIASVDQNIGIRYANNDIREDTLLLLRYNCPDADCDIACLGWPDLHRHVRTVHHKKICDLCSRHKKVFTHEHELYTDRELERHMKKGDDNPGALDQSGFKGHPLCGFCGQRFYSEDELFVHCREKHERCFICDRLSGPPVYFINQDALIAHYSKDHFPCLEKQCMEQRLIVFASQMDLKAHQLEQHKDSSSKDVRRDARVVDISSFDYRTPYVQERRGGGSQREQRDGRGRGRGRDPNAEPIPASSAQPLRRDEQAFQRQMAIQSAQSVAPRTFGGGLTTAPPPAQSRPGPSGQNTPRPIANVENITAGVANVELTPEERARQLRHTAVIERATQLLQGDATKLNSFRSSISSYKNNNITPAALIDSFFALFDAPAKSLQTLIREVADLYEDRTKADNLLTALNDWRAINEDYPSLPGPTSASSSTLPGMGWATVTTTSQPTAHAPSKAKSNRVLKLKSSTAQSSRSQVSQTASWGVPVPASSASNGNSSTSSNPAFPGLPSSSSSRPTGRVTTIPWVPSASSSSNPSSARPTPPTSRPASRGPVRTGGADSFPALPPAAKPQSTIFGYGRGMVRRDGLAAGTPSGFSWGGAPGESVSKAGEGDGEGEVEGEGKKRKGNKGKKQVLMNWG